MNFFSLVKFYPMFFSTVLFWLVPFWPALFWLAPISLVLFCTSTILSCAFLTMQFCLAYLRRWTLQKIGTDQKVYRKCSSSVIICWTAKIYLSINNSEKRLFTRTPLMLLKKLQKMYRRKSNKWPMVSFIYNRSEIIMDGVYLQNHYHKIQSNIF